jgi:hypothetical protein
MLQYDEVALIFMQSMWAPKLLFKFEAMPKKFSPRSGSCDQATNLSTIHYPLWPYGMQAIFSGVYLI